MNKYQAMVKTLQRAYPKMKVIDPMPYMCEEDKCFSYKDGNFLYADDDHFSVFGSKYIAEKFSKDVFL